MYSTSQVVRVAQRFAGARGIELSTLAHKAVRNGEFFKRLKTGRVTVRTVHRVVQWLSDNWPEGLEWPADIPRPEPPAAVGAGPKGAA